jgi:hypothetical protein
MRGLKVYLLEEGYQDHTDNTHFRPVGVFIDTEEAIQEGKKRAGDEAEMYVAGDGSICWQESGWLIIDTVRITIMTLK